MQRSWTNVECLILQLRASGRRTNAPASAAAIPTCRGHHPHTSQHPAHFASAAGPKLLTASSSCPLPIWNAPQSPIREPKLPLPPQDVPPQLNPAPATAPRDHCLLAQGALPRAPPILNSVVHRPGILPFSHQPLACPAHLAWRPLSSATESDFASLGLSPDLQARLASLELLRPLPVQRAVLPPVLGGRNAAIKSCTGSGKTLAYLLPVLQLALQRRRAAEAALAAAAPASGGSETRMGSSSDRASRAGVDSPSGSLAVLKQQARSLQALVLAPSRELCIQIQRTAQDLLPAGSSDRRLVQQLIGGANPKRQAAALAGGEGGAWPLVVVGTPGRVAELVTNGSLHVWSCPLLVLDEVDQLLAHDDFRQHVDNICTHVGRRLPPLGSPLLNTPDGNTSESSSSSSGSSSSSRQTIVVSASLDARVLSHYAAWCPNPVPVVLSSNQALPPQHLQARGSRPVGQSSEDGSAAVPNLRGQDDRSSTSGSGSDAGGSSSRGSSSGGAVGRQDAAVEVSGVAKGGDAAAAAAEAAAAAGPLSGVLPPHLKHLYVLAPQEHRTEYVRRLIHALGVERALLFVPKQSHAMVTKYKLEAKHMQVTILHGQLSKLARGNIVDAFRAGTFRALIVTDLGARGLDMPECDAAISFGVPPEPLSYAHRAGRTGRAGAPGVVVSVVTRPELHQLRGIAKKLGVSLQAVSVMHGRIVPGEEIGGGRAEESSTARRPQYTQHSARRTSEGRQAPRTNI